MPCVAVGRRRISGGGGTQPRMMVAVRRNRWDRRDGVVSVAGAQASMGDGILFQRFMDSEAIAVGDSDNDTAMFKVAGTSVAMGNVVHGIERWCDMQTTDIHDDGIANALCELGLI